MRRGRGWTGAAALLLLGGCAGPAPTQGLASARDGRVAAARSPAVACSTTWLVLATVSKCGSDGFRFGVGTE